MPSTTVSLRDLEILERLAANPDTTQADLADQLGVAVGTVNFALRRLISKGYVRSQQMQRRRLKYILTPSGVALRAKLAVDSLNYGMRLYRETRAQARALLAEAQRQGYRRVRIQGEGDLAEIVRLTCLEMKIPIAALSEKAPAVVIINTALRFDADGATPES